MWDLLPMCSNIRQSEIENREGFTLVEILIAVAIAAIIVAVVHGSLWGVIRTVDDARERMELSQTARGVLWRMSNEISNAFFGRDMGFSGEEERDGSHRLRFNSTIEGFGDDQKDIKTVKYYVSDSVLYEEVDSVIFPLAEGVDSFFLQYFDGLDWEESWDSETRRKLPKMVEINLGLEGEIFTTAISIPLAIGGIGRKK